MSVPSPDPIDVAYLNDHKIPELVNTLTKELFQDKPADAVEFLLESLKRKRAVRDAALLDTQIKHRK